MTQQDLENLFSPYGRIITSRILCDNMTGEFSFLNKSILFLLKYSNGRNITDMFTVRQFVGNTGGDHSPCKLLILKIEITIFIINTYLKLLFLLQKSLMFQCVIMLIGKVYLKLY